MKGAMKKPRPNPRNWEKKSFNSNGNRELVGCQIRQEKKKELERSPAN